MPQSLKLPRRARALLLFWALASILSGITFVAQAQATTFTVTRPDDPSPGGCAPGDCSLREAIMAANSSPGSTIVLPTGTYTLTIPGADGVITNAAIGDLDILAPTSIIGAGVGITIVQAGTTPFAGIHRVFDNHSAGGVYISNMTIRHGLDVEAASGGCIRNSGILTLEFVTVNGCESSVAGGGIASYHTLSVLRSTITGNRVTSSTGAIVNGGGIGGGPGPILGASSTVTISYSVLSNNEVSSAGDVNDTANGGGFANTAIMNISDSVITGNAALSVGGGINTATMTITNSIISENRARFSAGGVDNDGVMTVSHSTFAGNVAGFGCVGSQCDGAFGGGALNTSGGTMDVDSSTFSGNSCVRSGGGILNSGGTLTISSSTFAGNTCQVAAGVGASDTVLMKNTIVASNTATDPSGGDTGGLITSLGYNLIQRTAGSIIGGDPTGNIIGQDARLGPLGDNGGPTLTRALNVGSPALNTGNPGGCLDHSGASLLRDQRGYPRLQQGRCDIGAFEAGLGPARAIGDYDGDGKTDIVFQHTSAALYTWFMNGLSVSGAGPVGYVSGGWAAQGSGDFNGDGKADILWRHTSGNTYVWLMDGTTVSGSGSPGSVDGSWAAQGIGDFNGDGRADILWRHASGSLYLWFMNGTSIGSAAPAGSATTDWTIRDVGDYDGDGRADILWRHPSGVVYVWLMNGTSISGHGSPGTAAPDWAIETAGDFNADGRADILWRHPSGAVYVWLMNGTSISTHGSPGDAGADWVVAGAGDFSGDGRADILWRHPSGVVYVWLMNGTSRGGAGSPGSATSEWTIQ